MNFSRPPPTFWEAAADAILLRKTIRTLDYQTNKYDENLITNEEYLNMENDERHSNKIKKMYINDTH